MSPRKPRRALMLLSIVAILGAFAVASPLTNNAGAQPTVAPHVALDVAMSDDGSTATVTVALDPGSDVVAALDGAVSYNPDHATPTSCEAVDGFGACNPENAGVVLFAAASDDEWSAPTNVVELTFAVSESSDIGVTLGSVYTTTNEAIEGATFGDPVTLGQAATPAGRGAITGTILAGDAALFGTQICAQSNQADFSQCADVDSRGSYRIEGLATGSYTLVARHYSDEYGTLTLNDVAVVSPNLTQGVDGTLGSDDDPASDDQAGDEQDNDATTTESTGDNGVGAGNSVSGTVIDSSGAPVPAALVCVEDVAIGQPSCRGTGFDGSYAINNLVSGNYQVTITDPGGRYGDQDGPSFGLNRDQARTGVDFTLSAG